MVSRSFSFFSLRHLVAGFSIFFGALSTLLFLPQHTHAFAGGDGSAEDPYQIASCADFIDINTEMSPNFVLTADLDCFSEGNAMMIANPDNAFSGTLDGQGHAISIHLTGTDNVALFRLTAFATIKNLRLAGGVVGDTKVGALVGDAEHTTIQYVSSNANIGGNVSDIGGLVGYMDDETSITDSYSVGSISGATAHGVGGIVGTIQTSGTLVRTYATGAVQGNYFVGGLVGSVGSSASVYESFSTGEVTGSVPEFTGGLIGGLFAGGSMHDSYYDQTASGQVGCYGQTNGNGCDPVNTDGTDNAYFINSTTNPPLNFWDFEAVWDTGIGYPDLREGSLPLIPFAGGDGSDEHPYEITTCEELAAIGTTHYLSDNFILENDLDCSGTPGVIIGDELNPFTGFFNGGGHRVIVDEEHDGVDSVGFFSYISDGMVQDLWVDGIIVGQNNVGGIVGSTDTGAVLLRVMNTASVAGVDNTGGLVGNAGSDMQIIDSYNAGSVGSSNQTAGGIAGFVPSSGVDIERVYSSGTVFAPTFTGGLIGRVDEEISSLVIQDSFALGEVTQFTGNNHGGIIGNFPLEATTLSIVVWDIGRSLQDICGYDTDGNPVFSTEGICEGVDPSDGDLTAPQYFKNNSSNFPMSRWDFTETWGVVEDGYPELLAISGDEGFVDDDPTIPDLSDIAFDGGTGVEGDPYIIAGDADNACLQLESIGRDDAHLSAQYHIMTNIDCSPTSYMGDFPDLYNDGAGFYPIGSEDHPFTGLLTGENPDAESEDDEYFEIMSLFINRPEDDSIGMFSAVANGIVEDIYLNGSVIGNDKVGLVAGKAFDNALFEDVETGFSQIVTGNENVGGLIGYFDQGHITGSNFDGTARGHNHVGGLVGFTASVGIDGSYSTGSVQGGWDEPVHDAVGIGGLVGFASDQTSVETSYSSSEVNVAVGPGGVNGVGGLVGSMCGDGGGCDIHDSYATGSVSVEGVPGDSLIEIINVGGLVGYLNNIFGGDFEKNYALGDVTVQFDSADGGQFVENVGGLAGATEYSIVSESYAEGSIFVSANSGQSIGGLIGITLPSIIDNVYARGAVTVTETDEGFSHIGGLVGFVDGGPVDHSYSSGDISLEGDEGSFANIGGLVGRFLDENNDDNTITHSFSAGEVQAFPGDHIGGFMGEYDAQDFFSSLFEDYYYYTEGSANTVCVGSDDDMNSQLFDGETVNCDYYTDLSFFYSKENPPLWHFDFEDDVIWDEHAGDYPTLHAFPVEEDEEDTTPPEVVDTTPDEGAVDVPLDTVTFFVSFSEPIDPEGYEIVMYCGDSFDCPDYETSLDEGGDDMAIFFTDIDELTPGMMYTIALLNVEDLHGNDMVPYTFSFTAVDDGGEDEGLVLTEVEAIPSSVHREDAIYHFSASDAIEEIFADDAGDYEFDEVESSGGGAVTVFLDPGIHEVTFSGLEIGETYSVSFRFVTDDDQVSNDLAIGPFTIIGSSGGGGGGGGGGKSGGHSSSGTTPVVSTPPSTTPTTPVVNPLTLCTAATYPTKEIKLGALNDGAQVKLLEQYLNTFEGYALPVDGVYSQADKDAVILWQQKYAANILVPLGLTNGTGIVAAKSLAKIKSDFFLRCEKGTTPPSQGTPSSFVKVLKLGMKDPLVTALQLYLSAHTYAPGPADGWFGQKTLAAVKAFQAAHGLTPDGIVGPLTWAMMQQ